MEESNQEKTNQEEVKKEEVVKPEYVQDKFWNKDSSNVNIESLSSSYNSLEKKLGQRTEDLSKQIRTDIETESLKNAPTEYKLNIPDISPEIDLKITKDLPIVQWWDKTAKDVKLSQDQYDAGVKAFVDNAVNSLPNPQVEIQKLGDSGKARLEATDLWSKKYLSQDAYNAISKVVTTAEGVKAMEEVMKLQKDTTMPSSQTAVEVAPSGDDLKSMLNDPRYWDSARRDDAYVKRVTALYEKTFDKTK